MNKTRTRLTALAVVLAGVLALVIGLAVLTTSALAAPPPGKLEALHWEIMKARSEPEPVMTYAGTFYVTGYDICLSCCWKLDGITASGAVATVGRTCAMSGVDFGTRVYIEGIGERVVEDRGGGVTGQHIDVLCADHPACYAVTGWYEVYWMGG